MVVFGGMKDITKETNDMFAYDFVSQNWTQFQFEHQVRDPVTPEQVEEYKKRKSGFSSPKKSTLDPNSPNRSLNITNLSRDSSPTISDSIPSLKKKNSLYDGPPSPLEGRIRGRPPHPRDGHSSVLVGDVMYVFGGDRHQMPFNDVYAYRLVESTIKTPLNLT